MNPQLPLTQDGLEVSSRAAFTMARLREDIARRLQEKHISKQTVIQRVVKDNCSVAKRTAKTRLTKNKPCSKFPMIDKDLKDFVRQTNGAGHTVSYKELKTTALELAVRYGVEERYTIRKSHLEAVLENQVVFCGEKKAERMDFTPSPQADESLAQSITDVLHSLKPNLKAQLIQQLDSFIQEHLIKVDNFTEQVMKERLFLSSRKEVEPLIIFKEEMVHHLTKFTDCTIATLTDMQYLDNELFIDLAESLMKKLIYLSDDLLSHFSRLTHHVEKRVLSLTGEYLIQGFGSRSNFYSRYD